MATDNGIELIHCRLVSVDCPLEENVLAEKEKRAEHGKRSIWRKFRSFGRSRGMSRSSSANSLFASDLSTSVASSMVSLSSSIPEYCSGSSQNDEDLDDEPETSEVQTTCMLRNLPSRYTREMFVRTLDLHGFKGKYNLLYLPQRFGSGGCFHYAFVNFVTTRIATKFQSHIDGASDSEIFGDASAEIAWSDCQGLEANVEKYRNSSVMHPAVDDECRPLLLENGNVVPFPKPTKKIKQDRRNRKAVDAMDGSCDN
mmetsp:Transcript_112375/g.176863  ORF Transcript_112375/g.176863 Transcript_112375/m.176863 type:complete len:256 (-) Transcript_112375:10-777(-)